MHSYASTILKAFPENWVVTVLRPEATQLATPESDYLAAWQREVDFPTAALCHDMSCMTQYDSV